MPRFPFRWPVEVRGPRGERFFARSSEISGRGIGMVVDHLTAVGLAPGGTVLGPHTPVIGVQLQVPGEDAEAGIRLEGRVRHIRRLSQQQYLVGVNFVDPDAALQVVHRVRASGPLSHAAGASAKPDS
ncbi:MAG: PilZ domain-containing protein [Pseudomonadota bacterium]